ncbi:MAG TPA: hypothetical protein VLF68_01120, partial [Candidatus Saccharimonadales bacterium]|nr:hypothetical protein [Candidatus Saccharimonadales bacterium]
NNWTAGWGIAPSVAFFRKEAQDQKIFIATEGTFGMLPEALELYLVQNPNITIKGYWPFGETIPEDMLMYAKKMPSYFVVFQKENLKKVKNYPLTLIFKVKDAKSPYYYYVYQIMPPGKKI